MHNHDHMDTHTHNRYKNTKIQTQITWHHHTEEELANTIQTNINDFPQGAACKNVLKLYNYI